MVMCTVCPALCLLNVHVQSFAWLEGSVRMRILCDSGQGVAAFIVLPVAFLMCVLWPFLWLQQRTVQGTSHPKLLDKYLTK